MNLRNLAKGQECTVMIPGICNHNPETTVLAHLNGAGLALKHPDLLGAWCCSDCHDVIDGRNRKTVYQTWELKLWHMEGIMRTQQQLLKMGLLEIEDEMLTIGEFTLTRYPKGDEDQPDSYWLTHESGEGMQVWEDQLVKMIDEIWKEF